ncbi:MAG TPA: PDZ domain-containing protein [Egibacteraceae bacterium]|nr:PDZ domain-containing protein [Egibacteraceae bacterium]
MRVRPQALFLPLSILVLLTAAVVVPLPVFVERPGSLVSLSDHVDVAAGDQAEGPGEIDGDYLLTVVALRRASLVFLVHGMLTPDTELVPATRLTGGVDDATFFGRQREVFASTADIAAALGLRAAGYPVELAEPLGALVAGVLPGAPAEGALETGDIVTAVGDAPVRSAGELVAAVRHSADATLEIVVVRNGEERRVEVAPGPVPGMDRPGLGVRAEDLLPRAELPVPVHVDSGPIGGPSAGLLIALTVFDKASPEDLAAGRRIAGTGGVTADGTVTPIGGIGLKVVAAAAEGADVFLAPAVQVEEASAALPAGSPLQVVGVATFEEALHVLREGSGRAVLGALALAA